ncbi:MAG: hypothetical protein QGI57_02305 [Dehalococcoidales bacterium]|jgi:hypothetical protein|nr:hypothetical protein [Dehalococcoidales bacterium]
MVIVKLMDTIIELLYGSSRLKARIPTDNLNGTIEVPDVTGLSDEK